VVIVTPRSFFTPGDESLVPIGQEAGWASELVWPQRLEEKSFASAGNRTLVTQFSSLKSETILTELPHSTLGLRVKLKINVQVLSMPASCFGRKKQTVIAVDVNIHM
jgi:hypothetical protein